MSEFTYQRYLSSKKTVDDRSLDRNIVAQIKNGLQKTNGAPNILEIGGGVGTMIDRLIDWRVLPEASTYTIIDIDESSIEKANQKVVAWKERHNIKVVPIVADLMTWIKTCGQKFDLVIANAVFDILDVQAILPVILASLTESGIIWTTINFDGETIFYPAHEYDHKLISVYHASMGKNRKIGNASGDAHTGRNMFGYIPQAGGAIFAAGSSDWVVYPGESGYENDEEFFLKYIVYTIENELKSHKEVLPLELNAWAQIRKSQIENKQLVYMTHQLDFAITNKKQN